MGLIIACSLVKTFLLNHQHFLWQFKTACYFKKCIEYLEYYCRVPAACYLLGLVALQEINPFLISVGIITV